MTILDPCPRRCQLCDQLYVVESLARFCEARHLEEDQ